MTTATHRQWCVRPAPEQDELLSSWLHRLAIANVINDHTFCRHMFGRLNIWTRDLDRSFPIIAVETLSQWTGVSVERIQEMKLTHWAGRLSECIKTDGATLWILPIGVYHRVRRRCGLQFCSACLREGDSGAKWMWRMAWATCCLSHKQSLQSQCSNCRNPYMPHRITPGLFGRVCCDVCGNDYSLQMPLEEVVDADLRFQQVLENALRHGGCVLGQNEYLSLPLFEGIRTILRVILSSRWYKNWEQTFGLTFDLSGIRETKPQFEYESVDTRRKAMRIVWKLMQQWPNNFCRYVQEVHVPRWAFGRERTTPPLWLQSALDLLPLLAGRSVSEEEFRSVCRCLQSSDQRVTVSAVKRLLDVVELPRNGIHWTSIARSYNS